MTDIGIPIGADELARRLGDVIGADHVQAEEADRRFFAADFVGEAHVAPALVAAPGTPDEVASVVAAVAAAGFAVVGRGGGMSYSRAHVPDQERTVILDLRRLDLIDVRADDRYVICEAGVTWEQLSQALDGTGLWAAHLGTLSGRFATVGGGLSQQVVGLTGTLLTSLVLGLEVVLADGRVVRTGSWAAHGSTPFSRDFGPDLTGLFLCDSGAMGIKTRAVLRLDPVPASAYVAMAFSEQREMVAAMVEIGSNGLTTTCVGMDSYIVQQMTSVPPPDRSVAIEMAKRVLRSGTSRWRNLRTLARSGSPKMGYLNGVQNLLIAVCDAPDSGGADRLAAQVRRIGRAHGGKSLPIALPMAMRNMPFQDIQPLMFGLHGESNLPSNMLVPLSKAAELVASLDEFFEARHQVMEQHGTFVSYNWLISGHYFGVEPLLYFPGRPSSYRLHWASDEDREKYAQSPPNLQAQRTALEIRAEMIELARAHGSAHIQIGRSYPLAQALEGTATWTTLEAIKTAVDPEFRVNPGVLGLKGP